MLSFLWGLVLGGIQTWAFQQRTISIYDAHPIPVFFLSILISVTLWFSTYFVSSHDYIGFIGFSIGCAGATTLMAFHRKCTHLPTPKESP